MGDVGYQQNQGGDRRRIGNAPIATARVRWVGPIVADEVAFTLRHTKGTAKVTIPSPSYLHYLRGAACVDSDLYPDLDEFLEDVVRLYRKEVKALCDTGCCYLQIDEVVQALLCDESLREVLKVEVMIPMRSVVVTLISSIGSSGIGQPICVSRCICVAAMLWEVGWVLGALSVSQRKSSILSG